MYATPASSRSGLGIVPVVVIAEIPALLKAITNLFSGSSYDATHQQILAWASTILNDPGLTKAATADAWTRLRCWAGDQTVITPANTAELFGTGSTAQGCGCEVAHGCRADAQATVAYLESQIPSLATGSLSSSAYTTPSGAPAAAPTTSTTQVQVPVGSTGYTVGIPVPTSTITQATILGVPVWGWAAAAVLVAVSGRR